MKSFQDRIKEVTTKGWISCGVWSFVYVAFVVWVAWGDWASLGWIVLLPVIMDIFTTKYIPWTWWKKYKPDDAKGAKAKEEKNPHANPLLYTVCSWVDAILFALVAVYFINVYIFQNYQIPTSSLEKTLRVGDFLCVNKMCYGARVPNTPLSMPLVQHTMPAMLGGGKSYIEKPQWEYKRLKGWDKVEKGDIVVFNFPTGDTVCTKMQNPDYYTLCHYYGKRTVENRKDVFGEIVVRPVDRRENYVKRCVGTPGDSLQIINNVIYIDGKAEPTHPYLQYNYIDNIDTAFTRKDIDSIVTSVQQFLNSLVNEGKLLYATILFNEDENSTANMVNGDFVFSVKPTYTPNAKSITFKTCYTAEGLSALTGGSE